MRGPFTISLPAMRASVLVALLYCGLSLTVPAQSIAASLEEDITALEPLIQTIELIQTKSLIPKSTEELSHAAIKGMLQSIDPYSTLLTEKEFHELDQSSKGQFLGYGIHLKHDGDHLRITRIMQDSPAQKAGLKRGDRILEVNHQSSLTQKGINPFAGLPRKQGNEITFLIQRKKKKFEVALKMNWIPYPAIRFSEPFPQVSLIELGEFQNHTADSIYKYLQDKKPKVVLLDLRDNPGGLVFSAVEMVEIFLKQGKIVDLKDKNGVVLESYSSKGFREVQNIKLGILMNRNSASASEIFAGALQDHKTATLIGEQSFGKARVQSVFPIGEGLYAKMTFAYYYTPRGEHFDKKGLTPKIKCLESLGGDLYTDSDQIYQAGLTWAKEQLKFNTH